MTYRIEVEQRASKELLGLPKGVVRRLRDAIDALGDNPRHPGARKLTGRGGHRVRTGDYRVLYEIDDSTKTIRVYNVGHRKDVYR